MTFRPQPHVDFEPLSRALTAHGVGIETASRRAGLTRTGIYRARQNNTITVWAADTIAVRALGEHPLLIWGDQWLDSDHYRAGQIDAMFDQLRGEL